MSLEFKKIYSIANNIANLVITEHGDNFVGISKITSIIKNDHLAQLLLSKVNSNSEKVKIVIATYFILNRKSQLPGLEAFLMNLYVATIDLYEDTQYIEVECDECYGSGDEECNRCEGTGREDCDTCDSDGTIDCDTCDGEGTEECRYCDGSGTETDTEEDDEGNDVDVEVPCTSCDGEGTDRCGDCGGSGDFECPTCEGSGYHTCESCDGYGSYTCGYCGGNGQRETSDLKYNVRRSYVAMLGDYFKQYDGKYMTVEKFNEIEYDENLVPLNFELFAKYYEDEDIEVEDRRESAGGMDDDFVEIVDFVKIDNFDTNIGF
jgi:hypothetical protein